MSFRPGSRLFPAFRQAFRQPSLLFRRRIETSANPSEAQGGIAKFWNSPVGPKTVHFWAPVFKWGLVLTGVSDFARPADQLSLTQNGALTATGIIWTRWCFIIKPRNLFLASTNFFLGIVGATQVCRILLHKQSLKGAEVEVKAEGAELKEELKETAKKVEGIVKS